jgi:hypothetical protein
MAIHHLIGGILCFLLTCLKPGLKPSQKHKNTRTGECGKDGLQQDTGRLIGQQLIPIPWGCYRNAKYKVLSEHAHTDQNGMKYGGTNIKVPGQTLYRYEYPDIDTKVEAVYPPGKQIHDKTKNYNHQNTFPVTKVKA